MASCQCVEADSDRECLYCLVSHTRRSRSEAGCYRGRQEPEGRIEVGYCRKGLRGTHYRGAKRKRGYAIGLRGLACRRNHTLKRCSCRKRIAMSGPVHLEQISGILPVLTAPEPARSEERRVGKECRYPESRRP